MIGQSDFLDKYRIGREKFLASDLDWNELSKIAIDYDRFGAAAILGLRPRTLRARMYKLGIVHPETEGSG